MRNKEQEEVLEMVPELNFDESFAEKCRVPLTSSPQKKSAGGERFVFLIILNLLSGEGLFELQIAYSCN